ncbi:MAG: hypothetical protein V3T77_03730 [Planctomycetota bacterium]
MRKLVWIVCLSLLIGSIGCAHTERSRIWSAGYWVRVGSKVMDDLHQFRVDFDRIIFDLDDRPIEDY